MYNGDDDDDDDWLVILQSDCGVQWAATKQWILYLGFNFEILVRVEVWIYQIKWEETLFIA